ncbi:MAG: dolichyl-phosphate beta-glucosyltransferase [Candidatus Acidiferrales bacterium]
MSGAAPELSIVIPAYNEEARLTRTLARIREYYSCRRTTSEYPANAAPVITLDQLEILIVDDGSKDGTAAIAERWARELPAVRLISNGDNRGKGYSVRHGMLEARGRLTLFTDADLSSPIEESEKLLAALAAGNDVAIGSRALDRSLIAVHQSRLRELAGIIFNGFVRVFTGLPFHDTQCGFKIFRREAARVVFEQQRIERFGFDPEVLFLAKRHGLRTAEVPVRWAHDPATKVQVIRDSLLMFGDLVYIRWNWALGRYPKRRASS